MIQRLGSLMLIVVIGVAAYNFWQLERMRDELRRISAKVHVQEPERAKAQGAKSQDGLLIVLGDVKHHTKSAKSLMADGEYKQARKELDESLRKLEKASDLSTELAADAESGLGKTWSKVRYQVKKAWKEISEDQGKQGKG